MKTFSYSIDEEFFTGKYASEQEAAEVGFNDNPDNDTLWIGENSIVKADYFVRPYSILEDIDECACDECGEAAVDWLSDLMDNKDKCNELKALIADWIECNAPVKFWSVGHITEVQREES
jgi:hypothetical protein